jgi:hypothetical protein
MSLEFFDEQSGETVTPERFIERSHWTLARSRDHEYAVRAKSWSDAAFEWFCELIQRHGEPTVWYDGREYVYWRVGPHKYWTMGRAPAGTTIINRERLEEDQ